MVPTREGMRPSVAVDVARKTAVGPKGLSAVAWLGADQSATIQQPHPARHEKGQRSAVSPSKEREKQSDCRSCGGFTRQGTCFYVLAACCPCPDVLIPSGRIFDHPRFSSTDATELLRQFTFRRQVRKCDFSSILRRYVSLELPSLETLSPMPHSYKLR